MVFLHYQNSENDGQKCFLHYGLYEAYNPRTGISWLILSFTKKMSDSLKDDKKDIAQRKASPLGSIDSFKVFLTNDYHTFLVQKSERLASALYIITGFIPPEEPVRLKLRSCALDIVSSSANPNKFSGVVGSHEFATRCVEIGSILETAVSAGLISGMNARLMCDEYAALAHFAREHGGKIGESTGIQGTLINHRFEVSDSEQKDKKYQQKSSRTNAIRQEETPKKRQSDRRASILNLFKNRDSITIKDASSSIIGCSEKTIQRELLALVEDGILTKEGERRWTVYRRAKTSV